MLSPKDLQFLDKIAIELFVQRTTERILIEDGLRSSLVPKIAKACYQDAAIFMIARREIMGSANAELGTSLVRYEDILEAAKK